MNKNIYTAIALFSLVVSCDVQKPVEIISGFHGYEEFHASIEQPLQTGTKTYTDDEFHVLWHENDRVSIFNKFTYNQEYAFDGETGDNAGSFSKVGNPEFTTGVDLDDVYAVYPYQKSTKIDSDGKMTITLPAEQTWAERSFGRGTNTMIAAAADNKLKFKNIGGILVLKFFGAGTQVSSVTLKGNNGELLSGKAAVSMPVGGTPSVKLQSGASEAVSVICESPVALGNSESDYTEFWLVLPPTDFNNGFTVTVTCQDFTFTKQTTKAVSITRNHILKMAPIEVLPEKKLSVSDIIASENGSLVSSQESIVQAVATQGFIASDGVKNILVYTDLASSSDIKIGDIVVFSGLKILFNGVSEITNVENLEIISSGNSVVYPEARDITDIALTYNNTEAEYITFTGTLSVTDTHYNIVIDGADPDVKQGSIFWPWRPIGSSQLKEQNGKHLRIFGYFNGLAASAGGKWLHFLLTDMYEVSEDGKAIPEAVDLGLPSGLKWASANVGATQPEEYGDYFAWGETEPKTDYSWSTYKWCNGSKYTQTKYNTKSYYGTVDNKAVLDPEDDAAHVNWGGSWRMPTDEEWTELRTQCTWTWTSQNGVNGRKVTGPNGNSIFLPAAGYRNYTGLNLAGTNGFYWSSSLNTGGPSYACEVFFYSDNVDRYGYGYRYEGFSVRPVEGAVIPVTSIMMPSSLDLVVGRTATLSATISPGNATYKGLTWSSSDESVATVDASGKVTAVATGQATITAYSADAATTAACKVTVYQLSITLDHTELELYVGDAPVTLTATVLPDEYAMKTLTWSSAYPSVATVDTDGKVTAVSKGSTKITVSTTDGSNVSAACMVTVTIRTDTNGREYVDLGLPSGLKWATMNVGASKPEEYGEYFAWGETQPKSNYNWSTYKWCNGSERTQTKYNNVSSYGTVDNKTVLDPEDDAAHVNWGGSWRMPTAEECDELINKCTWTGTTQNGVKGRLVTGPNGKSIFLPDAGYRDGSHLGNAGSSGFCWSSSLCTDGPHSAYYVSFGSETVCRDNYIRCRGFSVRPVSE